MAENKTIAIDFGSTKIVVAYCNEAGNATVVEDDQSNRAMIACIGFTKRQRLFGYVAQCQATVNPKNTIFGGDLKSFEPHELSPLRFSQDGNKVQVIVIDYQNRTEVIYSEQLLAMLLSKVKKLAEDQFQCRIEHCVITIPSAFTSKQRISMEDSCKIAGFNEIRMINDTTASAITYAVQNNPLNEGLYVLIFDIGATSTEASIAYVTKHSVSIKANVGENNLGGENFVQTLVKHFIREFKSETGVNIAHNDQSVARLRVGCEDLKKILSTSNSGKVTLEVFHQGNPYDLIMTREIFELICSDLFRKVIDVGRKLFQSTLIQKSAIHATVLVGGGHRIPKIQQDLKAFMHGEELLQVLNQDEAIALGAAYYATWGVQVEELPRPSSLFGECSGLDIPKMQQLLQRFEEDEVAFVQYMAQVSDLEKLCYSYKRAIVKQNVAQEDEDSVVQKCKTTLTWIEDAQKNFFDRSDFRRKSKELKELYASACNKKQESLIQPKTIQPPQVQPQPKIEEKQNDGQALFDEGVALFTAEKYQEASEIFTYFIQISKQQSWPQHVTLNDLYAYRAHCYFHLRKYEKFFKDFNKIPKDRRTPGLKEMHEQATNEIYVTHAKQTLRKVQTCQRDAQAVTMSISMITSVLDTRPRPLKNFVQIHLTAKLYHQRAIFNFQLKNYDQAFNDAYQNMRIIHDNRDLAEERDEMYQQLKPYLRMAPKANDLYKKYGEQTRDQHAFVKQCMKENEKTKKAGLFYCC